MSNGRSFTRQRRETIEKRAAVEQVKRLNAYAQALLNSGQSQVEVGRAVNFAARYGFESMAIDGDSCVRFTKPSCGNENCIDPTCQSLEVIPEEEHDHSHG